MIAFVYNKAQMSLHGYRSQKAAQKQCLNTDGKFVNTVLSINSSWTLIIIFCLRLPNELHSYSMSSCMLCCTICTTWLDIPPHPPQIFTKPITQSDIKTIKRLTQACFPKPVYYALCQ